MNKSLLEISRLPADQIKVIDRAKTQQYPLSWHNVITILYEGKQRRATRRIAHPFGLCDGIDSVYKPEPKHGGKREGCGAKKLPPCDKKKPVTIYVTENQMIGHGGREKFMLKVNDLINK